LAVSGKEAADEICIPMGSFMLEPPESATAKRPAVDFPHSRHFDYSCKTCHHKWDYESAILTCTTSGCHDAVEPPKKSSDGGDENNSESRYFKDAFHNNCITCHKKIRSNNIKAEKKLRITDKDTKIMKAGPLSCKACHQPE
jgi:hypothetical protein